MKLAVVDTLWNWPPRGGADVDLFHVCAELQRGGVSLKLFYPDFAGVADQGSVDAARVPFPVQRIAFAQRTAAAPICARIREAVAEFSPDVVFVGNGFHLKPHVIRALGAWPRIARFYAYEAVCPRNLLHWLNDAPCALNQLATPSACRRCALAGLRQAITASAPLAWPHEYLAAEAWRSGYAETAREALRELRCALVYNDLMQSQLQNFCTRIDVVAGGAHVEEFAFTPMPQREPKILLMPGRAEDPLKGLGVLLAAGERLRHARQDFEVWATAPETTPGPEWFRALGAQTHDEMRGLYAQADVVAVPSVWEEPFGIVAVEAMATGRPVCASRTGGLRGIVVENETGFLHPPGNSAELAVQLERLLADPSLRARMGDAARARAEACYDWRGIVARHYLPVIESALARG